MQAVAVDIVAAEDEARFRVLMQAHHYLGAVPGMGGQAENLIKQHKVQFASGRTACQSPLADQLGLLLHTAAYWLVLALRDAVPRRMPLA